MRVARAAGLPRPRRPRNPEGRMPLREHLRELRRRLTISLLAVGLGAVVGWLFYPTLIAWLTEPLRDLAAHHGRDVANINFGSSITQPFSMQLKVSLYTGLVLASPVWLYEAWAFVMPGLKKGERRAAMAFIAAAVPLFLGGCALALWVMPNAVAILLGFTPQGAVNLLDAGVYLSFIVQFVVAFGIGMVLPVFLVGLNHVGILPARVMLRAWRIAVLLIFVFAAIMTPDPSAWSMFVLAVPMIALFFAAVGIAALLDRRRARANPRPAWADTPDDEASTL